FRTYVLLAGFCACPNANGAARNIAHQNLRITRLYPLRIIRVSRFLSICLRTKSWNADNSLPRLKVKVFLSAVEQRIIFCYSKGVASNRKYRSAYFPPGTPQPVVLKNIVSLVRRCGPCLARLTTF